ncbi:hypothetical protein SUGI_0844290 [Cryptomeria japonica]|nr:hypothetical protein SUGI_0844290 [Cryptomeria japonica]
MASRLNQLLYFLWSESNLKTTAITLALLGFMLFHFFLHRKKKGLPMWPLVGMLSSLVLHLDDIHDWTTKVLKGCGKSRLISFWPEWNPRLWCSLGSSGYCSATDGSLITVNGFLHKIIGSRTVNSGVKAGTNLLSAFMKVKTERGDRLYTDENLREIMVNFILAGRDTSSAVHSWFLWLLCNPRVEEHMLA